MASRLLVLRALRRRASSAAGSGGANSSGATGKRQGQTPPSTQVVWNHPLTPRDLRHVTYDRSIDTLLNRWVPAARAVASTVITPTDSSTAPLPTTTTTAETGDRQQQEDKTRRTTSGFDSLTYPLHGASRTELLHTIRPLMSPVVALAKTADSMPSVSSGLVTLSAPFRGAERYLEHVTRSLAAELDADFVSVRSLDIFPRVPPYGALITAFARGEEDGGRGSNDGAIIIGSSNGTRRIVPVGSTKGPAGPRITTIDGRPTRMPAALAKFIGIPDNDDSSSESGEVLTDQIAVPFPWYRPYMTVPGPGRETSAEAMLIPPPLSSPSYPLEAHQWITEKMTEYLDMVCKINPSRPKIIFYQDLLHLFQKSSSKPSSDPKDDAKAVASALLAAISRIRYQEAGRYAPFVVVAPHTTTFPHIALEDQQSGGIIQFFNNLRSSGSNSSAADNDSEDTVIAISEEEEEPRRSSMEDDGLDADMDTDDPHPAAVRTDGNAAQPHALSALLNQRDTRQKYNFSCFLDNILGVPSVPVIPTLRPREMADFRAQLRKDAPRIIAEYNVIELFIAADQASIELPLMPPDLLHRTDPRLVELIDTFSTSRLMSSELLSPVQIEKLLLLMSSLGTPEARNVQFISDKKTRASKDDAAVNFQMTGVTVTTEQLKSAVAMMEKSQTAMWKFNAPTVLNYLLPPSVAETADATDPSALSPGARSLLKLVKRIQAGKGSVLSQHEETIIKQCFVMPSSLTTTFTLIGGLEKPKQVIHDIIQLPLQRPSLFRKGILKQSTSGKTMLARATAAESGANFLSVSMSQIQSMWVGENEKNVRALFSLARKLKPCILFIDEVDALLQTRNKGFTPHWAINTINEFMQEWDGIQAESNQGIIVMGSTNRPFDLDEAVLRRMPRRILIDLPDAKSRQEILQILLSDDKLANDVSLSALAERTEMYSGSDLKNLCLAAALTSAREYVKQPEGERLLCQRHFDDAFRSVLPSLERNGGIMKQLRDWDAVYGTRGLMLGKGIGFV
ncbi:hypothetical protein RI367_002344 [Sorochytrium milnesiophthora]